MHTLDHMLRAGSVAVIGASERPGSVGEQTLRQLQGGGFTGTIHPVNPGYETVLGLPCHPSIHDVGGPVDLAVLAVANARLEEETEKAIARTARRQLHMLLIGALNWDSARTGRPSPFA